IFAKFHQNWTINDWKKVLFSDEKYFTISYQARERIWRKKIKEIKSNESKIMVWRCFSFNGIGDLIKIDGIPNRNKYKNILQHHTIPSLIKLNGLNDGLLLQDNNPIHKRKICTNYL